jgi:hypothetical protein
VEILLGSSLRGFLSAESGELNGFCTGLAAGSQQGSMLFDCHVILQTVPFIMRVLLYTLLCAACSLHSLVGGAVYDVDLANFISGSETSLAMQVAVS